MPYTSQIEIIPTQHNRLVPELSSHCAKARLWKNMMILVIIGIISVIIALFFSFFALLVALFLTFAIMISVPIMMRKAENRLFGFYRQKIVPDEIGKYVELSRYEEHTPILNRTELDENETNPAKNPSLLTSKTWHYARILQDFEGKFQDMPFQFVSASLVNLQPNPKTGTVMTPRETDDLVSAKHVWNGQCLHLDVATPFENEIDIFSRKCDENTSFDDRFVCRKPLETARDNDDFVQNGGNPYAYDPITLRRFHAISNTVSRLIYGQVQQKKSLQNNATETVETSTAQGEIVTLSDQSDADRIRHLLTNLSDILGSQCYTVRIRKNAVSIVFENVEEPFSFPGLERTSDAACIKLNRDMEQFVNLLEIISQ